MRDHFNVRQFQIFDLLKKHTDRYVTASELANYLSVSTKTVYREMSRLSELVCDDYRLNGKEKFGYQLIKRKNEGSRAEETCFYESPNERRLDIILYLLALAPNKTSILKLSARYYVSQTSILNDFKHIEDILRRYDLKLSKDNAGTSIRGSTIQMKRLFVKIIENYLKENGDAFIQDDIPSFIKGLHLRSAIMEKINRLLMNIQKNEKVLLDHSYYVTVFCYILSVLLKQLSGYSLKKQEKGDAVILSDEDMQTPTFAIAKRIAEQIFISFGVKVNAAEFDRLYQLIEAYMINYQLIPLDTQVNRQSKCIAKKLIRLFSDQCHVQIDGNRWLSRQLTLHVHAMLYRIRHHIFIDNPMLDSIKEKYGCTLNKVNEAVNELSKSEKIAKHLTEEEIGYLCIYFQLAVEKSKKKITALLECSTGIGTSHLLKEKLKNLFPELDIKRIVAQYMAQPADYEDVDLIITTMKATKHSKANIIVVSPMLSEHDREEIAQFIDGYYRATEEEGFQ